jgi:hypothetical protein
MIMDPGPVWSMVHGHHIIHHYHPLSIIIHYHIRRDYPPLSIDLCINKWRKLQIDDSVFSHYCEKEKSNWTISEIVKIPIKGKRIQ